VSEALPERLVLYDGECGLCDRSIQWLLDNDEDALLTFAPLQGETAEQIRADHPQVPQDIDTMVFVEDGKVYLRSRAVFAVLRHVPTKLQGLRSFRVLPAFLTDIGYRFIAAIRYRVWGRVACRIPSADERARFFP